MNFYSCKDGWKCNRYLGLSLLQLDAKSLVSNGNNVPELGFIFWNIFGEIAKKCSKFFLNLAT